MEASGGPRRVATNQVHRKGCRSCGHFSGRMLHFRSCIATGARFPYAGLHLKVAGLISP